MRNRRGVDESAADAAHEPPDGGVRRSCGSIDATENPEAAFQNFANKVTERGFVDTELPRAGMPFCAPLKNKDLSLGNS